MNIKISIDDSFNNKMRALDALNAAIWAIENDYDTYQFGRIDVLYNHTLTKVVDANGDIEIVIKR